MEREKSGRIVAAQVTACKSMGQTRAALTGPPRRHKILNPRRLTATEVIMNSRHVTIVALAAILAAAACRGSEKEAALPAMMVARFETEMKTILYDLKLAEETAYVLADKYLELEELTGAYFTRPVPESYELGLSHLSEEGYRARISHKASGLSCELEVGTGPGSGVVTCE